MTFGSGGAKSPWGALPLELIAGVIFFAHGLQKLDNPAGFAENALGGIPFFFAYLVIAAELGGGLLLLAGLLVRVAALGHLIVMTVAVTQVHWASGLTGRDGIELPLALLAIALALILLGPDPLSIDRNISLQVRVGRAPAIRGENAITSTARVKIASVLLMLSGVAVPVLRSQLGIPGGVATLVILILAGCAAVFFGASLMVGKYWAYTPAFILARAYLGASVLMLFWLKYAIRGGAALLISFLIVLVLASARRNT